MFGKKKQALLADYSDQPRLSPNVTEFMEKLGLSDDEIAEMAHPVSDVQRKIDESETTLARFVTDTNAKWSQNTGSVIDLQPYRMLPESCWDSLDMQHELLLKDALALLPAQPWNIILLAMDSQTAMLTGAGRFPTTSTEEGRMAINVASLSIVDELDRIQRTEAASDTARAAAAARIIAMARRVASASLGTEVVDQSRQRFFGD